MSARRGFTLVELMVALVLVLAVSGVTYTLLTQNQRVSRSQVEHAGLQDVVRSGALVVASELKEIGYDSIPAEAGLGVAASVNPDLLVMHPGRMEYRALGGIGFTCAAPPPLPVTFGSAEPPCSAFDSPRWATASPPTSRATQLPAPTMRGSTPPS